jgi:hypothetical protein
VPGDIWGGCVPCGMGWVRAVRYRRRRAGPWTRRPGSARRSPTPPIASCTPPAPDEAHPMSYAASNAFCSLVQTPCARPHKKQQATSQMLEGLARKQRRGLPRLALEHRPRASWAPVVHGRLLGNHGARDSISLFGQPWDTVTCCRAPKGCCRGWGLSQGPAQAPPNVLGRFRWPIRLAGPGSSKRTGPVPVANSVGRPRLLQTVGRPRAPHRSPACGPTGPVTQCRLRNAGYAMPVTQCRLRNAGYARLQS